MDMFGRLNSYVDQNSMTLDRMNTNQTASTINCDICGGAHHMTECVYYTHEPYMEQANSYNKHSIHQYPNGNPYSNIYSPIQQNPQNFSWSTQHNFSHDPYQDNYFQDFHDQNFESIQNQQSLQDSNIEILLKKVIMLQEEEKEEMNQIMEILDEEAKTTDQQIQQLMLTMEELQTQNKMLEMRFAQIQQSDSDRHIIIDDYEILNEEEMQGHTLEPTEQEQSHVPPPPYDPPVPFLQWVPHYVPTQQTQEEVPPEIPPVLNQPATIEELIPHYIEVTNPMGHIIEQDTTTGADKQPKEYGTVALTEECSVILQHNYLAQNTEDQGRPSIFNLTENTKTDRSLFDLYANKFTNQVSKCRRLEMEELHNKTKTLQLAGHTIMYCVDIIKESLPCITRLLKTEPLDVKDVSFNVP